MTPLDDSEMAGVAGAGIAIGLDDFRFAMAPTSYIEVTGRPTSLANWQRGDVRYYGLTLSSAESGAGTGTTWFHSDPDGGVCNQNTSIGCSIGIGEVKNFASVYDPFVLRVFQYPGRDFQGNLLSGSSAPTVLEFIGPSQSDPFRWSFWGEIEVGRDPVTGTNQGLLQSQTIISGRPATEDNRPSILRLTRTQDTVDPTLGLMYQSALSGDFRFGVQQLTGSPDEREGVPRFSPLEGINFFNVDAFIPLGHMHSQAITFNTVGTSGNFQMRITPIPDVANVYNDYYCGAASCATQWESQDFFGNRVRAISNPNPDTHGYVRWGDFSSIPGPTDIDNGIFFRGGGGNVNIGVSRIEGMAIQSLTLSTLGAGG